MERKARARSAKFAALIAGMLAMASMQSAWSQEQVNGINTAWVGTWSSPPMASGSADSSTFENQSIRQIAHISAGGKRVRVRISNAWGAGFLRVGAAHVALQSSGASIVPGTGRVLKFGGQSSVTIPAGALALSDPVDLEVSSLANLAITVYFPGNTGPATFQTNSYQTAYISGPGNFTSAVDFPTSREAIGFGYFLSGVDVLPRDKIGAVVVTGDSISLGGLATVNANARWTDVLSARLNQTGSRPKLGVLNQAIGCSRLLRDVCGENGSARFDRDELSQTGVTHVIIALGLVDIVWATAVGAPQDAVTPEEVIAGLKQLIERARVKGLKVYGATLTPSEGSTFPGFFTPENEVKRQAVNRWIRTGGAFDAVIDFDRILRDPAAPTRLLPAYASIDFTHPNDAGNAAMANAVDLSLFQ